MKKKFTIRNIACLIILLLACRSAYAQHSKENVTLIPVEKGWAKNSINAVVFRKNSLVTYRDSQYIAFYDADKQVVVGKRKSGSSEWELKRTPFQGNTKDAHNTISIMVDGNGFLHLSWDHHNSPLNYSRSTQAASLHFTPKIQMTGKFENNVSYPEFYKMPDGNLLFFYRDGGSGQGNLVIDKYDMATQKWVQLQSNLIDGQNKRNAYWQACVDEKGTIHISWVWRETPDVASNHDMGYACSKDGGITWQKSTGEKYTLPISAANAEYAVRIPQKSELINQTSMTTDANGNPFIATYWRNADSKIPQYHVIYKTGNRWQVQSLENRKTPFALSGGGSKRIPIARPQILVKGKGRKATVLLIYRNEERGNRVSVALCKKIMTKKWKDFDLTDSSVGSWEPTFDTELWKNNRVLNLFVQKVEQADSEGISNIPPQLIQVLEWKPEF